MIYNFGQTTLIPNVVFHKINLAKFIYELVEITINNINFV